MNPMRSALLWASRNRWLGERLPRLPFARRAVRRFMPGEELEAAVSESRALEASGVGVVLTELGENVATQADADAAAGEYMRAFDAIADGGLAAELSVKPTHLGLDLGQEITERRLRGLADRSAELGRTLWIDMEGSEYTDATLALHQALRAAGARVGLCIQANLRRTERDIDALLALKPSIRLVKGAYLEPAEIAYTSKAEVDASYARLARRLIDAVTKGEAERLALATHDTRLLDGLMPLPAGVEVQMLYGIRRDAQRQLAGQGVPLRVLISYGAAWFPWYMRRLAERPANVWFLARSLVAR